MDPTSNGQTTDISQLSTGQNLLLHTLMLKIIEFDAGDPRRIQHFIKVASLARIIGEGEKLDSKTLFTLVAAAIVHDIGIHPAEQKHDGRCDGKLQEQEGPAPARKMLESLDFASDIVDRVAYLVGHHHTYSNIEGADYQILVEADFLVNLFEDDESERTVRTVRKKIFRTDTGTLLLDRMFGLENVCSKGTRAGN